MNAATALACLLLPATAFAQQPEPPAPHGVIYRIVIGHDGEPAKGITLNALPLDGILATALPWTITTDTGAFRFEHIG
jgi:hypothetical protein